MSNDVFAALAEIDPDAHLALSFIAHECIGQRQREGWSREHDDQHARGEMATAGACYALAAGQIIRDEERERIARIRKRSFVAPGIGLPEQWPWDARWWKPKNAWRNLTRAGALIVAEMGRRIRARSASVSINHEIDLDARGHGLQKAGEQ